MAKKKSGNSPYAGMGSIKGGKSEVNPTFSLSKAPTATPTNGGRQVNPTVDATKKATSKGASSRTEMNPTYSVSSKGSETSKGSTGAKLVARKNKIGKPLSATQPLKPNLGKTNSSKVYNLKTKSLPVNAKGKNSRYDEENSNKKPATPKMTKGNFGGTKTQGGALPAGKGQITVKRLKKLGY